MAAARAKALFRTPPRIACRPCRPEAARAVARPAARALGTAGGNPVQYDLGPHRSNAEELVAQVPVIEVDGLVATCNGGGGALGHPIEYIQLNLAGGKPGDGMLPYGECKYCGLRFVSKGHH
mmetsp:Transcript_15830/g.47221  ORF Transcript_15830/g.47221 Transcript_15830/m.47221 type:complete len:122 (+) Transcript_15830:185-550(+)